MKAVCVIPARYASSRFPGKPLALIAGKPMIQWVYERAVQAKNLNHVLVATDTESIQKVVQSFGGQVVLTSPDLPSGTDRVAAAAKDIDADVIINLQGDEPFISPQLLDEMIEPFRDPSINMLTPIKKIDNDEDLENPNLVRVVKDKFNRALYFTRSVIPYIRDLEREAWRDKHVFFKHIGIYAYRKKFLLHLTGLPPSSLEEAERLEQLRVLENGYDLHTIETDYTSVSVDTENDLEKINELIKLGKINIETV